jgi:hypothetical protein
MYHYIIENYNNLRQLRSIVSFFSKKGAEETDCFLSSYGHFLGLVKIKRE